jgi:S-formylglutathione hydrolase FrmB
VRSTIWILVACLLAALPARAAEHVPFEVTSTALADNLLGDSATKRCLVYLPPGYADTQRRFPVMYFYHGYTRGPGDYTAVSDAVDRLVRGGDMGDAIVVLVDGTNRLIGAYFLDSPVTGGFETYVSRDLVDAIDATYRTIPHRDSRAIMGHSTGGYNAMRIGLNHPDRFGAVSAHAGMYRWDTPEAIDYFRTGFPGPATLDDFDGLFWNTADIIALYASAIPDTDNPPLHVTYPFDDVEGVLQRNEHWARFVETDNMHALERHVTQPDRLRGIQLVHGRNDGLDATVKFEQAVMFSERLTELGIDHELFAHDNEHQIQPETGVRFLAQHLRYTPPGAPAITRRSIPDVATRVGQTTAIGAALRLDGPMANGTQLLLDASALGIAAPVGLAPDGSGLFVADLQVRPARSGLYQVPVLWEDNRGDRYYAATARVSVYPRGDLVVLDEAIAPAWTVDASGGANAPDFDSGVSPVSGDAAGALAVKPESFVGWQVSLIPPEPIQPLGYDSVALSIHPGNAQGRSLALAVTSSIPLVGIRADSFSVDLTKAEWQRIVIPIDRLAPNGGHIEGLRLSGNLSGTFYLDDVRIVAGVPPHAATAVTERHDATVPEQLGLAENYPNPFNSDTAIRFQLPRESLVDLSVFSVTGQRIIQLVGGSRPPGAYTVRWDGRDRHGRHLASGVYLYRLRAGGTSLTHKLLLLR